MGSGGGSASGRVDYPAYMKTFHGIALDDNGVDVINVSLCDAMNYALDGASPYSGVVLPDADDAFLGVGVALSTYDVPFSYMQAFGDLNFDTLVDGYRSTSILNTYVDSKEARLAAIMNAESALLDEDINGTTLPQYRAGMRDIGACLSSAMVIGEANIWASKTKALAKNDAIIRWEAEKLQADLSIRLEDLATRLAIARFEVAKQVTNTATEVMKTYLAVKSEFTTWEVENEAKDKLWDVKIFQYGGNFLGAIAGSALPTDSGSGGNKMAGALGGAAAGAMIGANPALMAATGGMSVFAGAAAGGLGGYFAS